MSTISKPDYAKQLNLLRADPERQGGVLHSMRWGHDLANQMGPKGFLEQVDTDAQVAQNNYSAESGITRYNSMMTPPANDVELSAQVAHFANHVSDYYNLLPDNKIIPAAKKLYNPKQIHEFTYDVKHHQPAIRITNVKGLDQVHANDPNYDYSKKMATVPQSLHAKIRREDTRDLKNMGTALENHNAKGYLDHHPNLKTRLFIKTAHNSIVSKNPNITGSFDEQNLDNRRKNAIFENEHNGMERTLENLQKIQHHRQPQKVTSMSALGIPKPSSKNFHPHKRSPHHLKAQKPNKDRIKQPSKQQKQMHRGKGWQL